MLVKYEVTKQDYIDFNLNFVDTSKVMKRSIFIKRFFYPVIFLAVASLLESVFSLPITFLLIVTAVLSVFWILFYVKWFKKLVVQKVEKLLKSGKVTGLIGKHELELGEGYLTDTTKESYTRYETVEKVITTETHIFIYVSQVMAYIVPKKTFAKEDQLEAFLDKINQYKVAKKTK